MLDSTSDNDDLTPMQEYVTAGGVILLFGLLYWFLNHGWNGDTALDVANAPLPKTVMADHGKFAADNASLNIASTDNDTVDAGMKVAPAAVASTTVATTAAMTVPTATAQATLPAQVPAATAPPLDAGPVGPASPKAEATVKPAPVAVAPPAAYTLPDGTKVDIGSSGFGVDLRDAIANGQFNKPIVFDGIHFDSGSSKPNAQSDQQIKAAVALLHANPSIKLLIRGHTDETGNPKGNTELSLVRANEVGVALVQAGIDRIRLRIMGMGDSNPISTNATEEGRKLNRRIDALIIK